MKFELANPSEKNLFSSIIAGVVLGSLIALLSSLTDLTMGSIIFISLSVIISLKLFKWFLMSDLERKIDTLIDLIPEKDRQAMFDKKFLHYSEFMRFSSAESKSEFLNSKLGKEQLRQIEEAKELLKIA